MGRIRWGVSGRLSGGLVGLTALTVLAAVVAIYGTMEFRNGFDRIALTRLGQFAAVARLAQESQTVAVSAPRVVAAADRFGLNRQEEHTRDLLRRLDAAFDELAAAGADRAELESLSTYRPRLADNLDRLAALVAARHDAEKALLEAMKALGVQAADAQRVQDRMAEVLMVMADGAASGGDREAFERVVQGLDNLRLATHDINRAVTIALQVGTVAVPAQIDRMEGEARALLARARTVTRDMPPAVADGYTAIIDLVAAETGGEQSLFASRRRQLDVNSRIQGVLLDNALEVGRFVAEVDRLYGAIQAAIADERSAFAAFIAKASNALLVIATAAVIGAVMVYLYLRRRVLGRLLSLRRCMTANAEGQAVPVPVDGADEIADMGRAFRHFVDEVARREAELAHTSAQLVAATTAMPNGIIMLDRDGDVVLHNERYREIWRETPEGDLAGRPFRGLLERGARSGTFGEHEDPGGAIEAVMETLRRGLPMGHEQPLPDGRTILVQGNPEKDGGYVFTYTDITEQKRIQAALRQVNASLNESIRYARRIQLSLLPSREAQAALVGRLLDEVAVAWQPLDLVGGDYYWIGEVDGRCIVAVIDCTGHGVPGAFMTAIAASALARILQDHAAEDPALILARMNALVRNALRQNGEDAASNDGLDAAVCIVDPARRSLSFAGANLPLLYADGEGLHLVKGDRHSLGYRESRPDFAFHRHELALEPGMRFYLFTDGVTDHIGGPSRRLFGTRRLQEALRGVAGLPVTEQLQRLIDTLDGYRGSEPRRDDMTFIGFSPLLERVADPAPVREGALA